MSCKLMGQQTITWQSEPKGCLLGPRQAPSLKVASVCVFS